jgi:hypothetical protein
MQGSERGRCNAAPSFNKLMLLKKFGFPQDKSEQDGFAALQKSVCRNIQ